MKQNKLTGKAVLLLAGILLCGSLAGCESREGAAREPSQSSEPEQGQQSQAPLPQEDNSDDPLLVYEDDGVDDPELVAEAKAVIEELLSRAQACNDIYQAALRRNPTMEPIPMPDGEGQVAPVDDTRFETMDDLQAWFENTFEGEIAQRLLQEIRAKGLYMSVNGELYQVTDASTSPMTMGAWNTGTFKLLEMTEDTIVARMHTTLAGQDNDGRELTATYNGGKWLLGESYFLD